ncbi:MAG: tRNA (adenosine(37)-N6)-threonylcarbamoyltransferase complex dimerization subunit type 1 TsaB [Nocardioidaceae bacterium]|nr:tRNA (adenosine(37)-N6)-threonylcarbamoyltransferase complex dimerization subunit type 1 TsaB [Nocardioidaceae bacterium]NUS52896.1 tRNA (adenosine(37)-N6)-threonylcarbamoyltransferase complex dimerization subunit type 1 TsaB [Nocardioidaceae bacterium]
MLLAFDTATPAVTVALLDGERVVASQTKVDARRHGELLAPGITAVLDEAWVPRQDVTAVAVGVGPGPFTGLRVGLVTARTLALTLQIPVYGVCTLDVLAAQAVDEGAVTTPFLVATDARRKEVYWAAYDEQGRRLDGPHVSRPADVATDGPVVGAGARLYPDAFPQAVGPEHPDARVLARVVTDERAELLDPEPLYLRRPDAAEPGARKPVS